jgi:hemerythrin-like domain-containing protein
MPTIAAFGVAPLRAALLGDPIAFLSAEHSRQMVLLGHLERLARAPRARAARVMAGALLRWLTEELPVHIADEERSLYPRLRPHDPAMVDRLSADHRRDARLAAGTVRNLRAIAAGEEIETDTMRDAALFARLHRHHLELEEATAMPLATQRLSPAALADLAEEMAQRRGLTGE